MKNGKWLKRSILTVAATVFLLTGAASALADTRENPNVNGYSTTNTYINQYNVNYGSTFYNSIIDYWNFTNDSSTTHTLSFSIDTPGASEVFNIQDLNTGSYIFTGFPISTGSYVFSLFLVAGHNYSLQVSPIGSTPSNYHFTIS